jgi:hypothetical protein
VDVEVHIAPAEAPRDRFVDASCMTTRLVVSLADEDPGRGHAFCHLLADGSAPPAVHHGLRAPRDTGQHRVM